MEESVLIENLLFFHIVQRIKAKELPTTSLETELREIIRERDEILKDRFDHIIEKCSILDIEKSMNKEELFKLVAENISSSLEKTPKIILQKTYRTGRGYAQQC